MPQPNTVQVTAPIDTTALSDTYATHKSWRGQGGWSEVTDITERDAITTERRHQGMTVWVVSENKAYILKTGLTNGDWVEFTQGIGGGNLSGTLTAGFIPVATGANTVANSLITQDAGIPIVDIAATVNAFNIQGVNTGDQDLSDYAFKETIGRIYKNNASLFYSNTLITPAGSENDIPVFALSQTPSVAATTNQQKTVSAADGAKFFALFKMTQELNRIYVRPGVWVDKTWAYVSDSTSDNEILRRVMVSEGRSLIDTVTITGTGTSRTATRINGELTFSPSDANADPVQASYIETITGVFQITAYISPTSVTIKVPVDYVNQTGTDLTKHSNVLGLTASNIRNTTVKEITTFSQVSSGLTLLQRQYISVLTFIRTNNPNPVNFNIYVNGYNTYSHIETPETMTRKSRGFKTFGNDLYMGYQMYKVNSSTPVSTTFGIPTDSEFIDSAFLVVVPTTTTIGVDLDITAIYSNDENANIAQYTASDVSSVYNFFANTFVLLPLKNLIANARRGARGSIQLTSNAGALVFYVLGVEIFYR